MTESGGSTSDLTGGRPLVAAPLGKTGLWAFGFGLLIAGFLLFQTLEKRRSARRVPSIMQAAGGVGEFITVPELDVPVEDANELPGNPSARFLVPKYSATPLPAPHAGVPQAIRQNGPGPQRLGEGPVPLNHRPVYEAPSSNSSRNNDSDLGARARQVPIELAGVQDQGKDRVEATRFIHPATTVPKGTVMQAVLETALDSTRPGFARAIISRDVHGFDGSSVLVPRGSRLIGEYKADVSTGQKRALIQWQRLMRPDGVVINLDSPAADPLGRAGVGGKVNTHFFERFAGSILQSTLDIGAQLASRRISRDTYILALPGNTQWLISSGNPEKISPTITVRQGASVSVFVARDLDFTPVGQ